MEATQHWLVTGFGGAAKATHSSTTHPPNKCCGEAGDGCWLKSVKSLHTHSLAAGLGGWHVAQGHSAVSSMYRTVTSIDSPAPLGSSELASGPYVAELCALPAPPADTCVGMAGTVCPSATSLHVPASIGTTHHPAEERSTHKRRHAPIPAAESAVPPSDRAVPPRECECDEDARGVIGAA